MLTGVNVRIVSLQASISDAYAGHIFEYEDRFRVDRRKLELLMMNMYPPVPETAADFFGRIEEETGTVVIWPSRLKIGAKSKKGALRYYFILWSSEGVVNF